MTNDVTMVKGAIVSIIRMLVAKMAATQAHGELDFPFPELCFELLPSPSWREKGDPTTSDMLKGTAELISYYRSVPEATIAKVKEALDHKLACMYVLISNLGEKVGSETIGDTEDVICRRSSENNPPRTRSEQETVNTLRALEELRDIQKAKDNEGLSVRTLLTPSELRRVHQKLLEHDESREPGRYRSVLVYTDEPGPLKDPRGTIRLHSVEICLRGIAADRKLPEANGTMDELLSAVSHRFDCRKHERDILWKVARDTGYSGGDDIDGMVEHLLPECISASFGVTDVGRIVDGRSNTAEVLSELAKHYGISIANPPTSEDANAIHRKVLADLPATFHIYPMKTPELIEDTLQELYAKQQEFLDVFDAMYSSDDLKVCHKLGNALHVLARIAAYALFEFVCLHPFCDGNGRMCRLIASAIMSAIVPFPMGLACEQMPGGKTHNVYVNAIVDCRQREEQEQQPVELATLIVEGAYYCSLIMKNSLRDHLKLGEMTCAAEDSEATWRGEVASVYYTLDHSKRPGGHESDAEIEATICKLKEAVLLKRETIEVEFEDKFFVHIIMLY